MHDAIKLGIYIGLAAALGQVVAFGIVYVVCIGLDHCRHRAYKGRQLS